MLKSTVGKLQNVFTKLLNVEPTSLFDSCPLNKKRLGWRNIIFDQNYTHLQNNWWGIQQNSFAGFVEIHWKKVVNPLFLIHTVLMDKNSSKYWIPWKTSTKNKIGNVQIYPQFVLELKWHISMDIWYSAGKYILLLLLSSFFPCTGKR